MIVALLVSIFTLMIFLLFSHKFDIMYPSVLLCCAYILCICFSIYNWDIWNMGGYSNRTAEITFSAIAVFSIVGFLVEHLLFYGKNCVYGLSKHEENKISEIDVSGFFLLLNLIVCVLTIVWHIHEVMRITGEVKDWFETMNIYRIKTSYGVSTRENRMPLILLELRKYVIVQGYLMMYIITNNIVARRIKKRDLLIIVPIILMIIQILANASRLEILQLTSAAVCSSYVLWHRKYGWNKNISVKLVLIAFISLIGLLGLFYFTRRIVGRRGNFNWIYYICIYIGGSIKLFDIYINSPIKTSNIWGKETFYTLNQFLSKFIEGHNSYIRHLEFRYVNGLNVGNVYTAMRRYMQDFGVCGALILVAIFSFIMTFIYCSIKYSKKRYADFLLLFYCYIFNSIPMFPIDDIFYSTMISTSYIVNILIMYFMYILIVEKSIKLTLSKSGVLQISVEKYL